MNGRRSAFDRALRNVEGSSRRCHKRLPQRFMAETASPSQTIVPRDKTSMWLIVEASSAALVDAVQSALPGIRAALPRGVRLEVRLVEGAAAVPQIDAGCGSFREPCNLTSRQREILALLATGLSNKQIGRRLDLSHFTVRNHISQIMRLLGVSTRQEAAARSASRPSCDLERESCR